MYVSTELPGAAAAQGTTFGKALKPTNVLEFPVLGVDTAVITTIQQFLFSFKIITQCQLSLEFQSWQEILPLTPAHASQNPMRFSCEDLGAEIGSECSARKQNRTLSHFPYFKQTQMLIR